MKIASPPLLARREVITLLGGAAAAWPLTVRAQQTERMRRIGVLLPSTADDADFQSFYGAFLQALAQAGWSIGTNVRVDIRWATGNAASIRKHAVELAALTPDVILTHGGSTITPMLQITRTIPIVFCVVSDPVGAGYADSLSRPGGNITGFMNAEYSFAGKWLELLKEVAPAVRRIVVLRDSDLPAGLGQFSAIQTAAVPLGIEVSPVNVRDTSQAERALMAFARSPNGGLIVTASGAAQQRRATITSLAARLKLPAVYFSRTFVSVGGLLSYGVDFIDQYRRAASYVDRILKGENPADLPIQAPVKYQLLINLKTAKALGLDVPPSVLARADEVIE